MVAAYARNKLQGYMNKYKCLLRHVSGYIQALLRYDDSCWYVLVNADRVGAWMDGYLYA
jgi:hypothetical protein